MQEEYAADLSSPWLDSFLDFVNSIGQFLWLIGDQTNYWLPADRLLGIHPPAAKMGADGTRSSKFLIAFALVAIREDVRAIRVMLEAAEEIVIEDLLYSILTRETGFRRKQI